MPVRVKDPFLSAFPLCAPESSIPNVWHISQQWVIQGKYAHITDWGKCTNTHILGPFPGVGYQSPSFQVPPLYFFVPTGPITNLIYKQNTFICVWVVSSPPQFPILFGQMRSGSPCCRGHPTKNSHCYLPWHSSCRTSTVESVTPSIVWSFLKLVGWPDWNNIQESELHSLWHTGPLRNGSWSFQLWHKLPLFLQTHP